MSSVSDVSIISSHVTVESSIILSKYLPFSQVHVLGFQIYSSLLNRCVFRSKCGGGKDEPFLISLVPGISVVVGKMRHS